MKPLTKIAVDVCIGKRGAKILEQGGHVVVVTADEGERDADWFARAIAAGAEVIISQDSDLEILCYDHNVPYIKIKYGMSGPHAACYANRKLRQMRGWLIKPIRS